MFKIREVEIVQLKNLGVKSAFKHFS